MVRSLRIFKDQSSWTRAIEIRCSSCSRRSAGRPATSWWRSTRACRPRPR